MRIGVDLGGTKIEAVAIDHQGAIRVRRRTPSPTGDYDATVRAVVDLARAVKAEADDDGHPAPGLGVGIPGAVSPKTGLVKNANSTWLIGKPLQADLTAAAGCPVRLDNDANCFAVSEAVDGAGADAHVVFGVILGTGVGGGIAVDRQTMGGANAVAGEWGHTPLPWPADDERPGHACYCGMTGCIETWLSGPALAREAGCAGADLMARVANGDGRAADAIARYQNRLARSLAIVVNILDPNVIVLGGGVSNLDALFDPLVVAAVESFAFTDRLETPIRRNVHGDSGGVRGAAWLWPAASPAV